MIFEITFCELTELFSFLTKTILWFSDVLDKVTYTLYLICVQIIMIHVDVVEFSERRSEEVTSFFWRSVYFHDAIFFSRTLIIL